MYGEFKFFSFNKPQDWEKGWAINLQSTANGLTIENNKTEGVYFSTSLDSTEGEIIWHRLMFDINVPEDSYIRAYYFASDNKEYYIDGRYIDIDRYIMDTSVSTQEKLRILNIFWAMAVAELKEKMGDIYKPWLGAITNPHDILLHKAKGRYLWLKIEFAGNQRGTPILQKLRIYYPRMSFLSYLPGVYQEDEKSRDFLERFLSLFGTFLWDMEEQIGNVAKYFDVDCVEGEYLKYLASWLAVVVDDSWNEKQLKQLVKKAPEIYKKRGTKQAIEEMIEICTGEKPIIIEYFQLKNIKDDPKLKDILPQLYSMDPYTFCVLVRIECVPTVQQQLAVEKILDKEKPAFTEAKLILLQPWIYLDAHTYLGVNTRLSQFSTMRLDPESSMLYNNVLIEPDKLKKEKI